MVEVEKFEQVANFIEKNKYEVYGLERSTWMSFVPLEVVLLSSTVVEKELKMKAMFLTTDKYSAYYLSHELVLLLLLSYFLFWKEK